MTPIRPLALAPERTAGPTLNRLALGLLLAGTAGAASAATELPTQTVSARQDYGYRSDSASVASFDEAPLLDTPASISVINEDMIKDQQARLLSEVLRNDASVGQSYAPVGYYENFEVRGFSLNAASSYKINGRTITGEQNVALENKQRVEVLKGLSGLQSGVSEPGGLINYVTKRPTDIRSVTVSTDDRGSGYLATDVGGWFGSEQQFGLRANLAHEDLHSYVEHANGQRDFASLAFDWNISPNALLQLDIEYQNKEQRSAPGYQLLGGTALPHHASPKKLLAHQSGSKPVTNESLNISGNFEYRFNDDWKGNLSASRSRVVIDDYSSFAWGGCTTGCINDNGNYFSPEGNYDIYDFRSPDDTRRNDEVQAVLSGRFDAGGLGHELSLGTSAFRRVVNNRDQVMHPIGDGNIDSEPADFSRYNGPLGDSHRRLDSRQYGLFLSDRISFNEQWQTVLGGREVRLDEKASNTLSGTDRHTQRYMFLPQAALIYKPMANLSLYTQYGKGLSLGGQAPWFITTNKFEILAPTVSRQIETGIKYDWQRMSFTAALFQMRQAYQYARPDGNGQFTYIQQGQQKNTGLELSANGWATQRLQVAASVAAIRARVEGTGTPAYEGHQALNVPRLRASLQGDYALPWLDGLALLGGMQYSASKYADRTGNVSAGSYAIFNIGSRYSTRIDGYDTVFRLTVDNLFDKRYWRDVGEYLGDDYLFQGAPLTARLSASINF
ncbi:TonB-dependent siderophore receptor [Pseudomonas sessilinigenes]|uniref:TonB-dependent siderophore receptor n=1 Tax=Pseudomonas sessilinigenes TaxID=658629 RepID=A0ABX8MJ06_9PSED|nr:TonB-dependent siderophore receptor [Pseudomonas sessilinigenes]AZC27431.1 Ferrichrome-iron receptor [Pseudomonas sessilinigenes]QXH38663.1 TonB-dependent siderophore receptor [Pseudomonas sessilinigenes]